MGVRLFSPCVQLFEHSLRRNDAKKVVVVPMDHCLSGSCVRATGNRGLIRRKSWWEHIKVLAADSMEGRDTGSPGLKRAEEYVVGH